jgi:hypothetical protein
MVSFGERNRSDPFSEQGGQPGIPPAYSALLTVQAAHPAGRIAEVNGVDIANTPKNSAAVLYS